MRKRAIILIIMFLSSALFLWGCESKPCVRKQIIMTGIGYQEVCVEYDDGTTSMYESERKDPYLVKATKTAGPFNEASASEPYAVINLKYVGYNWPGMTILVIDGKQLFQVCFLPPGQGIKGSKCSFRIAPGKHKIQFQVYRSDIPWETRPWILTQLMVAGTSYDLILSGIYRPNKPNKGFNLKLISK